MHIDCHTHIYDDVTLSHYLSKTNGRIDRIITYPYWEETGILKGLDTTINFASTHGNVYALGTIDLTDDIESQLAYHRELFEQKKIVGIKLYPGYQHVFPSDTRVDPIAELCGEFNKPLVFHSGLTHSAVKGTMLKYSKPEHIDEIATRHPHTNFVICHFSYPNYMAAAEVLADNDNVYSEISGIACEDGSDIDIYIQQNVTDLKRVFTHMIEAKSKIMFGTDYVGTDNYLTLVHPYFALYDALFPESDRERVFGGLAEEVFFS